MSANEKIDFSIVIPTYNEEKRADYMRKHFQAIDKYFKQSKKSHEIIVALDGPTDKTPELVKSQAKLYPTIKIINRKKNKGKGFSIREGFAQAKGSFVLWTDMDGATPIHMLDRAIKKFEAGADIAIGSRDMEKTNIKKHQPRWKELLGDLGNKLIQALTGLWGIEDTQCGFKVFTAEAAKDIFPRLTVNRWGIDFEALMVGKKLGYKIMEFPVEWHDSNMSLVGIFDGYVTTIRDLFKVRWNLIRGVYHLKNKSVNKNK